MTGPIRRLSRLSTSRIVALFVIAVLLPLIVFSALSLNLATGALRQQAEGRVRDLAVVSATVVQQQMEGLTSLVNSYATRPRLVTALENPGGYDLAAIDSQLTALHASNAGTAVAFLTDPSGRLIDAMPTTPGIVGQHFSYRDWYHGVMSTGHAYVSEAYQTAVGDHPRVVAIAAPIHSTSDVLLGIVVAGYAVDAIQSFVKVLADGEGLSLTTTDRRGTVLAGPGTIPAGFGTAAADPSVAAALHGQAGVRDVSTASGDQFEGFAPVPGLGWTMRVDEPSTLALAGLSTFRNSLLMASIVVEFVLAVVLAGLLAVLRRRSKDEALTAAERKQATEADALFTMSLDMCAVANFEGIFKRVNPAWTTTLGYRPDQLTSRPFVEFIHPDDVDRTVSETAALSEGAKTVDFENRYRHVDGSYRTLAWSARGDTGSRLIYCVARDVTAQKELEEGLRTTSEQATALAQLKSDFLANMSHEIRTPMNGVIGMTDLLLATPLNSEQAEYAETIRRSGDALLSVINDILDFSKIEAGRLEVEEIDMSIAAVVEDVAELVAAAAHRANLEVITDIDPRLPHNVLGDPGRLRQVLLNLVGNAVKFTAAGEVVITVRATSDEPAETVPVRFEVRDTGIGITADVLPTLFTPFTQEDASTTRRFGGTGLGLAISKQLVTLMGGDIGVDSEPGKGSVFWVTLPFRQSESLRVTSSRLGPTTAGLLAGLPVLVVDDNATNRTILIKTLTSWGALPQAVEGGAGALQQMRRALPDHPFPLVLIDYLMPGMDGLDLARRMRQDQRTSRPKLVLLTSSGTVPAGAAADAGIDAMIGKPLRQSVLYDTLVTVLQGGAASAPTVAPQSAGATPGAGARVLVAEDNAVNQVVARRLVEMLGYQVDIVNNGAAAVEAAAKTNYAAILMDCQMPVMDGFEATAAIRQTETNRRRLPIIAMTAAALQGDSDRCLAAGMDDYVSKPVHSATLGRILARWIPDEAAPASRTARQEAVLDTVAIADLHELDRTSQGGFLAEMVGAFSATAGNSVARIREALISNDMEAVAAAAHHLKGSSGSLGAIGVMRLCESVEDAIAWGRLDEAADRLVEIEQAVPLAMHALAAEAAMATARDGAP